MLTSRDEVKPLVKGVSGNIHQGFFSHHKAKHTYIITFTMGALHCLLARHNMDQQAPASITPMPDVLIDAFASALDNFLGAEWHVIFRGKRSEVYPAW